MEGDGDDTPVDGLDHYLHEGASLKHREEVMDFDLRYDKLGICLLNIIAESLIDVSGNQEVVTRVNKYIHYYNNII